MKMMYTSGIKYDYIFKLHTKKDLIWRHRLLKDIADSELAVRKVIQEFESDPKIGMVACDRWVSKNDNANQPIINELCRDLKIGIQSTSRFVAGTIFWVRWPILKSFIQNNNIDLDKEYSKCEIDYSINSQPTYMHSWERIFGFIIDHFEYQIKTKPLDLDIIEKFDGLTLPVYFNWMGYLKFNQDIVKCLMGENELYIDNITKISFGISQ